MTTKLIKEFEGCRLEAYQDQRGIWTIGYGHTRGVKPTTVCTEAQADAWLAEDIASAVACVRSVSDALNANQFEACVSLAYNIGNSAFLHSTVVNEIKNANFVAAADAFLLWDKTRGRVNPGLAIRRAAERTLFLTPINEVNN